MVFRILAVLSEFERDLISERTKASLSHLRHQGRKTGGHVPYGFDNVDGELVPNRKETKVVEFIKKLHRRGYSLRAIGRELQRKCIRTKRGSLTWSINVLASIIRRST